jgi:hypothetical protein
MADGLSCDESVVEWSEAKVRYRQIILPDFPKHLVTIKFILGTPALPEKPLSSEAMARTKLMGEVNAEMAEFGDMVMLPVSHFRLDRGGSLSFFSRGVRVREFKLHLPTDQGGGCDLIPYVEIHCRAGGKHRGGSEEYRNGR